MIPYIISNDAGTYVNQSTITDRMNGLGRLADCLSCKANEQLNREKTATLRLPMSALHADKIVRGGLLLFDDSEHSNQLWRIDSFSKTYNDGLIDINCNHISYDLNKLACQPFSATGVSNIINKLNTEYVSYKPFTFSSDVVNSTASVSIQVPTLYREIIGSIDGNILDVLKCEIDWDNLAVKFLQRRGTDRNITIRYGTNIIDARQEESIADTVNSVYGYVKKGDDAVIVGQPYYQGTEPSYPLTTVVDLTNTFGDGDTITPALIKTHAQAWAEENDVFTPEINFTIDYLSLKTVDAEKWGLFYDVKLGDTVNVFLPNLGTFRARVTEITYDVLNNRPESITIGNQKTSLADTIMKIQKDSATLKAYPVGSFYTSASKTNPSAIFGGEWTLVSSSATSFTFKRTN